jgi:FkbM family methyltransferase
VAGSAVAGRLNRFAARWSSLARLAPGRLAAIRFWVVALELAARHGRWRHPRRSRSIRLVVNGVPVTFAVRDIGELHGLREVLAEHDYAIELPDEPETILDLGGNIGAASVYFATRWPRARIVVAEPDPNAFARLVRNVRPFPSIEPLPVAVADRDGEVILYRPALWTLTSSVVPAADASPIRVRAASLDSLIKDFCGGAVDLVKLDVEGAEYGVLRESAERERIPALVGELHVRAMGASLDEFRQLFAAHDLEIEPLPNGEHAFRARLRAPLTLRSRGG